MSRVAGVDLAMSLLNQYTVCHGKILTGLSSPSPGRGVSDGEGGREREAGRERPPLSDSQFPSPHRGTEVPCEANQPSQPAFMNRSRKPAGSVSPTAREESGGWEPTRQSPARRSQAGSRRRRLLQAEAPGEPDATLRGVGEEDDASQRRSGSRRTRLPEGGGERLGGHVPG